MCMNTLILIAHPNKHSFSHIVAQEYAQYRPWFRIVDLYDASYKQDFLQLNETNRPIEDPLKWVHQGLIRWADEIIFCFPLWRFDCPAILKNRFDINFSSGFAYKYRTGKFLPEKLLHNKQVRVFCTAGGASRFYQTIGWMVIVLPWRFGRIHYVWLVMKSWTWFADMNRYKTPHSREWMKNKIKTIANKY